MANANHNVVLPQLRLLARVEDLTPIECTIADDLIISLAAKMKRPIILIGEDGVRERTIF
jgi:hypothetical protein